jgi:hypothetical protein
MRIYMLGMTIHTTIRCRFGWDLIKLSYSVHGKWQTITRQLRLKIAVEYTKANCRGHGNFLELKPVRDSLPYVYNL